MVVIVRKMKNLLEWVCLRSLINKFWYKKTMQYKHFQEQKTILSLAQKLLLARLPSVGCFGNYYVEQGT